MRGDPEQLHPGHHLTHPFVYQASGGGGRFSTIRSGSVNAQFLMIFSNLPHEVIIIRPALDGLEYLLEAVLIVKRAQSDMYHPHI